jgi:hypothetical protein
MRKYAFNEIPNLVLSGLSFPNWGTKKGCHLRNSLWFDLLRAIRTSYLGSKPFRPILLQYE